MKLSKWLAIKNSYTKKVSDLNRHLAYVGLGIIWIFKLDNEEGIKIAQELILPTILIIFSLFLDLMQYLYLATAWCIFYRVHERKSWGNVDKEVKAPVWISNVGYAIFASKILTNAASYILILNFAYYELLFH